MLTYASSANDLVRALRAHLSDVVRAALDRIVLHGPADGGVYAVGGTVRDLLLGQAIIDVDLAVEGDAIAVVREALPAARANTHARFGTATLVIDGTRIDMATARAETYARPGALPKTRPASIDEDLRRRDFAVNALALRLDTEPALLDPCGGGADIASRQIRVVYDGSFVDDATRIFRALRYAARLDFELEKRTAHLLREGLRYVDAISGDRLRREIERMLGEARAGRALEAAHASGALQAAHPALHWSTAKSSAYHAEAAARAPRLQYGFALLSAGAPIDEAELIVSRLKLTREEAAAVRCATAMRKVSDLLRRPNVKPSGVAMLLDRYPMAAVLAFAMTTGNNIASEISLRYLDEWRGTKPLLTGRDLVEIGVPEGPQVQRGLQLLRAARLDGWARAREDERALIMRFVKSLRDSGGATSMVELDLSGE